MNRLKAQGVGIIFVTHFLEQVYAVCDRITVLRNGELVGEYETKDLPRVMLVAKMMGKDFDDLADIKGDHAELKEFIPVIEAEGIGSQKEASVHSTSLLTKVRLSDLQDFLDQDVPNWFVRFMVQTNRIAEK